ncbi:MAG: O-methyltransferase [Candidatus Dormibacteraeota bacterium]|nr:O-methyltransferase [Candidatus Dormibacteraeota bacterium]MBV9526701.1 O-methyltransferase [Candidatus Dormibacteraeota bacterium]
MDLVAPQLDEYLLDLARTQHPDAVLDDMEQRAREQGFPIVGRAVGRLLETQARGIGARRVMELGSGYGYSAYWFSRAVGDGGSVVCTDMDPGNARDAEGYLQRAGLWDRVRYRVGDALSGFAAESGEFDIVYCDVDKTGYPDCWRAACERIRVGGLYLCDNVLWSGRVAEPGGDANTEAIREHNRLVATDDRFVSSIVPLRDGVMIALRVG